MNKIITINIIFLLLLTMYLLIANLGLFGLSFVYSSTEYSPCRSHLWPRANYEVIKESVILNNSTWLDLNLPVMFQSAHLELRGENLDQLEIAWKETVGGEVLLLNKYSNDGVIVVDFSGISRPNYLVFSFPEGEAPRIDFMKLSFSQPRWFYDFKKNMLK